MFGKKVFWIGTILLSCFLKQIFFWQEILSNYVLVLFYCFLAVGLYELFVNNATKRQRLIFLLLLSYFTYKIYTIKFSTRFNIVAKEIITEPTKSEEVSIKLLDENQNLSQIQEFPQIFISLNILDSQVIDLKNRYKEVKVTQGLQKKMAIATNFNLDCKTSLGEDLPNFLSCQIEHSIFKPKILEVILYNSASMNNSSDWNLQRLAFRRIGTPLRHSLNSSIVFTDLNNSPFGRTFEGFKFIGRLSSLLIKDSSNTIFVKNIEATSYNGTIFLKPFLLS